MRLQSVGWWLLEGCASLLACLPEGFGNGSRFLKNFKIREAQDLDSPSRKNLGASFIGHASSRRNVLAAIHLNGEAQFMTVEVEHKWINWVLASEFNAHLAAAHEPPQHEFRTGLAFSEGARQLDELGWSCFVGRVGMRQSSWCAWAPRPEDPSLYVAESRRDEGTWLCATGAPSGFGK